jgi:enoyl-CoA hydratase/carnithine racemase
MRQQAEIIFFLRLLPATSLKFALGAVRVQYEVWRCRIGQQRGDSLEVRLARALPTNIAMRFALTGKHERMSAQRAYELGLVSEVVEHDRLLERAREIANIVNRNAPLAVRGTRLAIVKGLDLPLHEAEMLAEAFRERNLHTEDSLEGPKAFVEKRPPEWQCR